MRFTSLWLGLFTLALAATPSWAAPYAQLSSTENQLGKQSPTRVTLNSDDALKEIAHDKGTITIKEAGTYFVMAAAQVGSSSKGQGNVRLWMRINGKDVDNSNTEQTVTPGFTAVLVCQGLAEVKAGDKIDLFYSVSKEGEGLGLIASSPKGEPVIPSVIFSAFKADSGSYAQLSSTQTQIADPTPRAIALDSVDAAKGVDNAQGAITVKEDGVYFVMAAGQAGSTQGADQGAVRLWMRVNGKDVDNSNTEQSIAGGFTGVLVCQGLAELKAGDKVQLMQSATKSGIGMIASRPKGEPVVPSMIFSLFKVKAGPYAQLSSTETQPATAAARALTLNSDDAIKEAENTKGTVTVRKEGTYFVIAAGQVGGLAGRGQGSVKLWMGLNGKAIDNSNTEQTTNQSYTAVLVCQGIAELKAGDRLQLLQSASGTGAGMIASTPRGEPLVPSMIFSLFKVD
jgi:hypothetical protein